MARVSKMDREEAIARLREWLKPGDTVHTVLRHVSRSGMSRDIGIVVFKDGDSTADLHPNYAVAAAIGAPMSTGHQDAVRVGGCGMDMGFHVVSTLSRVLFPDGFGCIGEGDSPSTRCPSSDHSNGDRSYRLHGEKTHECAACHGKGKQEGRDYDCPVCDGKGKQLGHWHRSGDYALRHHWL